MLSYVLTFTVIVAISCGIAWYLRRQFKDMDNTQYYD